MPRFSIVVPAYNAETTLPETLDAVAAQTFDDWECVVVDDGSTDSTAAIVQAYAERDPRFVLVQQKNAGAAGAHITGVAESTGEFIVICAADDFLLPGHLASMDEFIRANPDYQIYSSNGEYLDDETGERRPVYASAEWRNERSLTFEDVLKRCFYGVGAAYRRTLLETAHGYRTGVYSDDYDFWLRALASGARHRYTPQILSVHRLSSFQQTANPQRVHESNTEVFENLIREGWARPDQIPLVEAAIRRERAEYLAGPAMADQARRLEQTLERVLGRRLGSYALRVVHSVSWMVRPVRTRFSRKRSE